MQLKLFVNLALALGIASFGLAACNTVEGAGQDIKNVGQGMKNASENVQEEM